MSENGSFGQRAAALSSPASLLELEAKEGRTELFADVDALLAEVLKGDALLVVQPGRHTDSVSIVGLDARLQTALLDLFAVASQQSRGAWFLPEKASLKAGWVKLPTIFTKYPRFAAGIAWNDQARRVVLSENPAAVFLWAVLEPLFEKLFLPFELRGRLAGTKSREDRIAAWASVDEIVSALGLEIVNELAAMRDGEAWSRLHSAEQVEVKQRLLTALASQTNNQVAARYRAYRLLPLIARYYRKAHGGQARRNQVLTRVLEKTVAGFFGGDWLKLLRYLGEMPHPDEEIAAAIPKIKLLVGSRKSPGDVATETGLPAEEVERALSTYWNTPGDRKASSASPVDERDRVLRAFWWHFDEIHTRQTTGMRSLWGLVEESGVSLWAGPNWYTPRLYLELLPPELVEDIERLWASIMLPRWPDRIVTEISPHRLMAATFGPALHFWHGAALTAWFVCEGTDSRTDMAGLAIYHRDALVNLERQGSPIDPELFAELRDAELHLGPQEPVELVLKRSPALVGLKSAEPIMSTFRRSGFERLRDIITRYRRAWSQRYLVSYLRTRSDSELREAGRLHAEAIAENGRPPTPSQFARHAVTATNHWLGGDLSSFYAAIGERSAIHPVRSSLMPADRLTFARSVFETLSGQLFEHQVLGFTGEEAMEKQEQYGKLNWLAEESLRFLQLEEALDRAPEIEEFGASAFANRSAALSSDVEDAWKKYAAVVEAARQTIGKRR